MTHSGDITLGFREVRNILTGSARYYIEGSTEYPTFRVSKDTFSSLHYHAKNLNTFASWSRGNSQYYTHYGQVNPSLIPTDIVRKVAPNHDILQVTF